MGNLLTKRVSITRSGEWGLVSGLLDPAFGLYRQWTANPSRSDTSDWGKTPGFWGTTLRTFAIASQIMTGESTPVGTIECDFLSWGTNTFVTPGCGEFSWLTDTMTEYQLSEHFNQIIPPKLTAMGDCSPLTSAATSDCSDLWQALGDCPNHYIFGHFVRPGPTAAQKAYLAMMFLHFCDFPIIGNYGGCQLFNMCNQTQVDDFVGGRPEPLPGYPKRLEVNSFIQGNFTLLSNELLFSPRYKLDIDT